MVPLTRLDGSSFFLNPALIVTIEEAPDTVINLSTGTSFMVLEDAAEVVDLIVIFHRRVQVCPSLEASLKHALQADDGGE